MADTNLRFDIYARDHASRVFHKVARAADHVADRNERISTTVRRLGPDVAQNASAMGSFLARAASGAAAHWAPTLALISAGIAALPLIAAAAAGALMLALGGAFAAIGVIAAAQNKKVQQAFTSTFRYIVKQLKTLAQPFEPVLIDISRMFRDSFHGWVPILRETFREMAPVLRDFAHQVFAALDRLKPAIGPITEAFNRLLQALGPVLPIVMDEIARGLVRISEAVAANPQAFAGLLLMLARLLNMLLRFIAVLVELFNWLQRHPRAINAVRGAVMALVNPIMVGIALWNAFRAAMRFAGQGATGLAGTVTRAVAAIRSRIANMIAVVRTIPGRIRSAVGSMGSLLVAAGRNVVSGLINGIRSRIGALAATASRLAATIRSYLPFSPAKTGPLSGSGAPEVSGARMAQNFAAGMTKGQRLVEAAAAGLAQAAATHVRAQPVAGLPAAGAAGGVVRVELHVTGTDEDLKRLIRKMVRVDGRGSVQLAFGGR